MSPHTAGTPPSNAQAIRAYATVAGSVTAARTLHTRLLDRVVRLPMAFFDSQPSGRLLNRFSKDTEAVDTMLGEIVQSALTCAVNVAFAMAVVAGVTPAVVLLAVPLAFAYLQVQASYMAASREVKRLDSLALSPIFGGFSETLAGLATLRAFRAGPAALAAQRTLLDASARAYWPMLCLNRWLSVRLELLGIAVVFGAALTAGVLLPVSAGVAGLALTSALNLTGLLNWMVRKVTELEVNMNCVERMDEYSRATPEADAVVQGHRPPPGWPAAGAVTVAGLVVRYRPDLDPVLRGVSFDVPAGSKVGVAGRTGCGKSTLMLALFRIVEAEAGHVVVDGVSTADIGLFDLRSRLALVPQDPVIFSGSVRTNLDPFAGTAAGDADLWRALDAAGLGRAVRAMARGLDEPVAEGGTNLSAGQRQVRRGGWWSVGGWAGWSRADVSARASAARPRPHLVPPPQPAPTPAHTHPTHATQPLLAPVHGPGPAAPPPAAGAG